MRGSSILMAELKILSMNCRGLGEHKKRRDVIHYIKKLNYNIVFLQETHTTKESLPYFNNLWQGKCYHSFHSSRSRGSCILFSKSTQHNIIKEINSPCGNYVIVICKINTETFAFVSVYGPNNDQPLFFQEMFERLNNIEVDHTVLGGDFNFIMDSQKDSLNYNRENNINAKEKFKQLMLESNITDVWRRFNPMGRNIPGPDEILSNAAV